MSKKIVIGSRGSKLALLYAQMAKDKIIKNTNELKSAVSFLQKRNLKVIKWKERKEDYQKKTAQLVD